MWRLLNQPLPATPHLSPGGFAIFLAIFSLLPGLSNFVLAIAALLWFLGGMVHWLMGYRNLLLHRESKTSAFGISEPTITFHP
ncbi:MAG: FHIPEP family type III secretion protein [Planctomycetaceae bacterium]|nr:FHIPEP family type III secretion protein [Planctomycetaceae bacterium]MCP4816422.1 FHIPEP family type III secretion protein [Planctomycetaceae bacterium]